ncbi:hypothetical protein [Deinococcus depolymerans]|uniref:SH3 domain-containing protein n=1 Tax=Deinococcus depolymerans TaxID=392408 RepID=A0ABP3MFX5_9DEIO
MFLVAVRPRRLHSPARSLPPVWSSLPALLALLALPLASAGAAGSLVGVTTTRTPQYVQPDPRARQLPTLPTRTSLVVYRCFPRWCEVSAGHDGAKGWVLRAGIRVNGTCQQLVPLGFKDLRRHEGGYRSELDLNGNGRACDEDDLIAERLRGNARPTLAVRR